MLAGPDPEVAHWVADTMDAIGVVYTPPEWAGPDSGVCGVRWAAEHGQRWICTEVGAHDRHRAHDSAGEVVASRPLKPSPRPRKKVA